MLKEKRLNRREFLILAAGGLFSACVRRKVENQDVIQTPESPVNPNYPPTPTISPTPDYPISFDAFFAGYLEINRSIKSYGWLEAELGKVANLIRNLTERDSSLERISAEFAEEGIAHLKKAFLLTEESLKFNQVMQQNISEIRESPDDFSRYLAYSTLLESSVNIDFHEIGTTACFNGISGHKYNILDPAVVDFYRTTDAEVIEEIEKRCEKIFWEIHAYNNPKSIMIMLYECEEAQRKLIYKMKK